MDSRNYLIGAILVLIVFAVTDCSLGESRAVSGTVRMHRYKEPYTSIDCSTDRNGKQTCRDTYHPAEYHLIVYVPSPEHVADIDTKDYLFFRYRDGDGIAVGERCGKWTNYVYLNWIDESTTYARAEPTY